MRAPAKAWWQTGGRDSELGQLGTSRACPSVAPSRSPAPPAPSFDAHGAASDRTDWVGGAEVVDICTAGGLDVDCRQADSQDRAHAWRLVVGHRAIGASGGDGLPYRRGRAVFGCRYGRRDRRGSEGVARSGEDATCPRATNDNRAEPARSGDCGGELERLAGHD